MLSMDKIAAREAVPELEWKEGLRSLRAAVPQPVVRKRNCKSAQKLVDSSVCTGVAYTKEWQHGVQD